MLILIRLLEEEQYYNKMITTLKKKKKISLSVWYVEKTMWQRQNCTFSAYDTSADSV